MSFFRFLKPFIFFNFLCLVSSSSLASGVYRQCNFQNFEICTFIFQEPEYWAGGRHIGPYKNKAANGFVRWTSKNGEMVIFQNKGSRYNNGPGLFIANTGQTEYEQEYTFDGSLTTTDYNTVFPSLKKAFLNLQKSSRLDVQRNLKQLELYSSKVDGKWGRKTLGGIISYNALFNKRIPVYTSRSGNTLLLQIIGHKKFSYLDGNQNSQVASSTKACDKNPTACTIKGLCNYAVTYKDSQKVWETSQRWIAHAREAKRRGLTCDVKNQNSQVASSTKACDKNPTACTIKGLCNYAVTYKDSQKVWETSQRWIAHAREAKRRGLTCDVKNQNSQVASSTKTCDEDPNICGAVQLCQKASIKKSGNQIWRNSSEAAPYIEAAKSIGLSCNVQSEPIEEKVFRVASGTGFFVSENGYVVTNQHVIDGCTETRVHSREKTLPSSLIAKDGQNDLALLQVDYTPDKFFKLSERNPSLLQEIIAAGYPFGNQISNSIKVTRGIVSAMAGLGDNVSQMQIDAALQPGNSGGPIIDDSGSVVGVAVAKLDAEYTLENFGTLPENTNFGIKVSVVKSLLESNNVPFEEGSNREMQRSELGKLVTDGTVFLSCWMTTAQYEKMKTRKAMFEELERD